MKMSRPNKDNYYLHFAKTASERSTCLKRNYGAVIVKDDRVVSTGYNGAPRGSDNCHEIGKCPRMDVPSNTDYTSCRSVHAEANAIIQASYNDMIGSTLYLYGTTATNGQPINDPEPCPMCKRLIINAGIKHVIVRHDQSTLTKYTVSDWVLPKTQYDTMKEIKK